MMTVTPTPGGDNIVDHLSSYLTRASTNPAETVLCAEPTRVVTDYAVAINGPTAFFRVIRYEDGELDAVEFHHSDTRQGSWTLPDAEALLALDALHAYDAFEAYRR